MIFSVILACPGISAGICQWWIPGRRLETGRHISLIRFDGPLYFANTGYFEDKVLERAALKPDLKYVIIDAEGINEIDATGMLVLPGVIDAHTHPSLKTYLLRKRLWKRHRAGGATPKR